MGSVNPIYYNFHVILSLGVNEKILDELSACNCKKMAFDSFNKRQAPLQIGFQRVTRFTFDYHCQGAKTSNLILWAAPSEYPIMKSSEVELSFIIMFSLCFIESSSYLYFVVISLSCCNFIIIIDFYYKQISFTKILSKKVFFFCT